MNNFTTVEELMIASNQELPTTNVMPEHPLTQQFQNPQLMNTGHLFQDVHLFDYTYKEKEFALDMSDEEKIKWIQSIKSRMTNPIAQHGVDLILANINQDANLDRTNQKRAEDLLVSISKHIESDQNLLPLIEEQLQDMVQLGQCAQGRTTRLWQIYTLLPKND